MICSVALNPSIDRTLELERLNVGGLNRVKGQTDVAAGKGMNVALAAAALGEQAACIGLMYREGGAKFEARLREGGAESDFVWCDGAVRVNVKVFDREKGEITELNSSGTPVSAAQLEQMAALTARYAQKADALVLTGSLPPGCPVDLYAQLAEAARGSDCRVFLDADGERLRAGLRARPFLIKPNRYELELLSGESLDTLDKICAAARRLTDGGVRFVVVSMGGDGALMTDGEHFLHTAGLRVQVRSTVAAGDSMIAGLAAGFARGLSMAETFRLGVAAATARCMTPPEQLIRAEDCAALAAQVEVRAL